MILDSQSGVVLLTWRPAVYQKYGFNDPLTQYLPISLPSLQFQSSIQFGQPHTAPFILPKFPCFVQSRLNLANLSHLPPPPKLTSKMSHYPDEGRRKTQLRVYSSELDAAVMTTDIVENSRAAIISGQTDRNHQSSLPTLPIDLGLPDQLRTNTVNFRSRKPTTLPKAGIYLGSLTLLIPLRLCLFFSLPLGTVLTLFFFKTFF